MSGHAPQRRTDTSTDRRAFLGLSLGAVLCAAAGCASLASVTVPAANGRVRLIPSAHPGLEGPGGFLKLRPEGWDLPLYVLRDEEGGYAAVSPICTHLGCVVEIEGRALVCPCHGSTYARTGEVVRGPAERALRRFPVTVEADGALSIDVSAGER
jgi:Rieske Fe-S protein